MPLDWSLIRERYGDGAELPALFGQTTVTVTAVGEDEIFFKGRLWTGSLRQHHLQEAVQLVQDSEPKLTATDFLEVYRLKIEVDPSITPGCSKIPNLAAVVLKDLGYFVGPTGTSAQS